MRQQTVVELIAWHVDGSCQSFALKSNMAVLVGKSSNCGLQLAGQEISDIHCSLRFEQGQLWVQDWMSAIGTRLDGEPVTCRTQVGQGSIVEVGLYKIQMSDGQKTAMVGGNHIEAPQESFAQPADVGPSEPVSSVPEKSSDVAYQNPGDHANVDVADQWEINRVPQGNLQVEEADMNEIDDERTSCGWMESDADLFSAEDEVYDRETVELLQAEIEDLRTALAQVDADRVSPIEVPCHTSAESEESEESEKMLHRIQELVEEANRADERVLILEEMLHAAEDANRSEIEERAHLEAWVGDIEKRIGQREQEHAAELENMRERLDTADENYSCLQSQLQQAATSGDSAQKRYEETMEDLQQHNRQLQDFLAEAKKEVRILQHKCENQSEETDVVMREERAKLAREHAETSRLKFEYAQKIRDLEEVMPKSESEVDPRLQGLREHRQYLREMSEKKKKVQSPPSLSNRLKRLWNSIE